MLELADELLKWTLECIEPRVSAMKKIMPVQAGTESLHSACQFLEKCKVT